MTRRCALWLLLACSDSPPALSSTGAPEAEVCAEPACQPPRGVIEAPRWVMPAAPAPVGASCETALPLRATGEGTALLAATGTAPALGCAPARGAAGADFELDMCAHRAPLPVQVVVVAPGPVEVGLARGACGDLRVEQCATPLYPDERSRLISTTLAPDRYLLLVDSAAAGAQVHVNISTGALSCSAAPANDECGPALPLDPGAPVQSLSGTLACARQRTSLTRSTSAIVRARRCWTST